MEKELKRIGSHKYGAVEKVILHAQLNRSGAHVTRTASFMMMGISLFFKVFTKTKSTLHWKSFSK